MFGNFTGTKNRVREWLEEIKLITPYFGTDVPYYEFNGCPLDVDMNVGVASVSLGGKWAEAPFDSSKLYNLPYTVLRYHTQPLLQL